MAVVPHPTLETRYLDHPSPYVLPWWTRPALEWLLEQPVYLWHVFEWRCGLSSVWFNQAARQYVGVESNPAHALAPGVLVVPPDGGLTDQEAEFLPTGSKYVKAGIDHGSASDLVVDNANWPEFAGVADRLRPLFREYHRFDEPGRTPQWSTDVYIGRL